MNEITCPESLYSDSEEKIHYDSPFFPLYLREELISAFRHERAEAHFHKDLEYILIKKGRLGYEVNGQSYVLEEGEGIFVNSMALHFGYAIEHAECDLLCLLFPPYLLANCPAVEENMLTPYLHKESALLLKKDSPVLRELEALFQERNTPSPDPLLYSALLFRLWGKTLPLFSKEEAGRQSNSLTLVKMALAYVKAHYSEDLSLSSFASALSISSSLLTKLFRNYLHDSPMDYVSSYRLSLAAERLKTSDESVKTIALSSGFRSANFFARSFKKKYGVSPKSYRAERPLGHVEESLPS